MTIYYSELGESADASALFHAENIGQRTFLEWQPSRNAEALAVFREFTIRARAHGDCCASVTFDAARKLRPFISTAAYL